MAQYVAEKKCVRAPSVADHAALWQNKDPGRPGRDPHLILDEDVLQLGTSGLAGNAGIDQLHAVAGRRSGSQADPGQPPG